MKIHVHPSLFLDDECGVSDNNKATQFIANGEDAQPGDWPWIVALYRRNENGLGFICGGTIVTSRIIVTGMCIKIIEFSKYQKLYKRLLFIYTYVGYCIII